VTVARANEGIRGLRFRVGAPEAEPVEVLERRAREDDEEQLLWVDVTGPSADDPERLARLDADLGLGGALTLARDGPQDGIRFAQDAVLLVVTGLSEADDDAPAQELSLTLVAAPNLVVSVHAEVMPMLERPIRIVASDPRFGRLDAGTFLGLLLDGMLDGYFREVERVERQIDLVDDRALRSDDAQPLLDELVHLRRRIARLRRALAPQREVFAAMTRPVDPDARSPIGWPWPGLPDRLERALDAIEHARDQLLGSFELVSTRTAERTNDVMRILTVISGLLLPSVVIAGVMGMNFKEPFFDDPSNFLVVLGCMAGLAAGILLVARWRQWL
jgi:Mg2+ and Co2+ transporter CorA